MKIRMDIRIGMSIYTPTHHLILNKKNRILTTHIANVFPNELYGL